MAANVIFKSACLWLLFILHSVGASQIASFVNEHYSAPQVIKYDPDTKLIMYSPCNGNNTSVKWRVPTVGMGIDVVLGASLLLTTITVYISVHLRKGEAVANQGANA